MKTKYILEMSSLVRSQFKNNISRYINPPKRETQAAECRFLCLVIPTHQRQCLVDVHHQMVGTTEHQILSEAPAIIIKQGR